MNTVGLSGASNPIANFGLQTTLLPSLGAPWSLGGPAPSMLGAVWPYGPSPTAFPSPSFPNPTLTSPSFLQASSLPSLGGFTAPMLFLPQGVPNAPPFLHALPVYGYSATAGSAPMREASDAQPNKDDSIGVISVDSELNAHEGRASTPAKVYRCHKCEFTTKCVDEMCQHWDTAHRAKHTWLICPKCAYRSRSMASMTNHGKAAHNEVAFEVGVCRMNPREESQERNKSIDGEATNVMKRIRANILRVDAKRSKVVPEPTCNAGDGSSVPESEELHRAPTAAAVSSRSETPELLAIDERDDECHVLEQRPQQSNQHNEELVKKNGELSELVKQLQEQLAEKEQDAKEKDALLETLSEENARLNSDALRHQEAQQQLLAKHKELCSQITELLHAATERAGLTPQSPLSLPLQAAICYVDLLQQSPTQLDYMLQMQALNSGPSLQQTRSSCLESPPFSR